MRVGIETSVLLPMLREAFTNINKITLPLTKDPKADIANVMARSNVRAAILATVRTIEWKMDEQKKETLEMAELFREEE